MTPRSFGVEEPALRDELSAAVGEIEWRQGGDHDAALLMELVSDVHGWIAGVERIDREVLAAAPELRVVARYGVGIDNVDLEAAAELGIVVTNTPGANAAAVAELVIGLIFAVARRLPWADRAIRRGEWPRIRGVGVEGRVVGLLGLGAIGAEVARRAKGLGCAVIAHDPGDVAAVAERLDVRLASREEVVATSDFLSLHLPATRATARMVNAELLAAMKPGSYLVNAARGELVDEAALAAALRSGHLAGAALDCLAVEPPVAGFVLGELDEVVLTPHIGAHTDQAAIAMGRAAIANCLAVLNGREAPNPVRPAAEARR